MFVGAGGHNTDDPLPLMADLDEIKRMKMIEDNTPIKGILKVNIPMARGLRIADAGGLSDPYAVLTFPDKKKITTKEFSNTLEPVFRFEVSHQIDILTKDYKPLRIDLKDKDTLMVDDDLGHVIIEWTETYKNPGLWQINKLFKLQGEAEYGQDLGEVYVQIAFIQEGKECTMDPCKTIPELLKDYGRVAGPVKLSIISGEKLKNMDFMGKSDPYCIAYLSSEPQAKIKTPTINDNLDPVWQFEGELYLDVRRLELKSNYLFVEVYDEDNVKDEMIGFVKIPLSDLTFNPHMPVCKDYPLAETKDQKKDPDGKNGIVKIAFEFKEDESKSEPVASDVLVTEKTDPGKIFFRVSKGLKFKKPMIGSLNSFITAFLSTDLKRKDCKISSVANNTAEPGWDFSGEFDVDTLVGNAIATQRLILICKNKGKLFDSTIGGFQFNLKDSLLKPGEWFNEIVQLKDDDGKVGCGSIFLQAQFRPNGKNIDTKIPDLPPPSISKNALNGSLFVKIICGRKLASKDLMGKSDGYCICTITGADKPFETKVIEDNSDPQWNHEELVPISIPVEEIDKSRFFIQVRDKDPIGSDLIGENYIELAEYFRNPGKWYNSITSLIGSDGKSGVGQVYFCFQFRLPDQSYVTSPPENMLEVEAVQLAEKEAKKKEAENKGKEIKGFLAVNILEAKELKKVDLIGSADPYVVVKVTKGGSKQIKTKFIKSTLNPVWNHSEEISVNIFEIDVNDLGLCVDLFDHDTLKSDDQIAAAIIELKDILKNPGSWLNNFYPLYRSGGKEQKGQVLIQAQWRPEGIDIDTKPPNKPDKVEIKNISGRLTVDIQKAVNVLNADIGGKSDPYAKITFSHEEFIQGKKKFFRTQEIQDDLNPVWNNKSDIDLVVPEDKLEFFKGTITVFDADIVKDEFIGKIDFAVKECFDSLESVIEKCMLLLDEKGKPLKGEISFRLFFSNSGKEIPEKVEKPKNEDQKFVIESKKEEKKPMEEKSSTGILEVMVVSATGLKSYDKMSKSDPYIIVEIPKIGKNRIKTKHIDDNNDPVWNHKEDIAVQAGSFDEIKAAKINILIYDYNYVSDTFIGENSIEMSDILLSQDEVPKKLDINNKKGAKEPGNMELKFKWKSK